MHDNRRYDVIWHPYGDDTSPVTIEGPAEQFCRQLFKLGLINEAPSAQQVRDLDYAIARKRDINWPWFGCIRYGRAPEPLKLTIEEIMFLGEDYCSICGGPCLRRPRHNDPRGCF